MHKKIIMACMAIAAFAAFVVAPAASAVTLTENGSAVAVGKKIEATNVGDVVLDIESGGTVTCSTGDFTGELTENGTNVTGDITNATFSGTGASGDCTSSSLGDFKVDIPSLPWCIKAPKGTDTWELKGGNCPGGTGPITFILTSTGLGITCRYERTSVTGTFNTGGTDVVLTVGANQTFTKELNDSFFCPASGILTGAFTLETDGGGVLTAS
jgi:hypothetical protein